MSLLDSFARPCVLMEKTRDPSPEGGWVTAWKEGASFKSYQYFDSSMEARMAQREGVTSVYSVLVDKDFPIEYNDAFKDLSTGATYRVTSRPKEKVAPASSSFNLKFFTAERWELPA